jgi:hypothetical protein
MARDGDEISEIDLDTRAMLLDLPQDVIDMLWAMFGRWKRIGPDVVAAGRGLFAEFLQQSGDERQDERFSPFVQDLLGVMNAWKLSHPSARGGHDD